MRSSAYWLGLFLLLLVCPVSFAEERNTADEFKFMELRQQLRERPQDPKAHQWIFAMGEYYFKERSPETAAAYFKRLDPLISRGIEDLMASVYLLRCALSTGDNPTAQALTQKLQDSLSSRQFLAIFDSSRERAWQSPLGNRFKLTEKVDSLEIDLNGKPFYTIDLS